MSETRSRATRVAVRGVAADGPRLGLLVLATAQLMVVLDGNATQINTRKRRSGGGPARRREF